MIEYNRHNIQNLALDPVVNFGKVTVNGLYLSTATSVALLIGHGARLPNTSTDGPFNLVWYNSSKYADPSDDPDVEIIRCTLKAVDSLAVIERGQENTSISNKNSVGDTYKMILAPTKKMFTDIPSDAQSKVDTHSALTTGIHGTIGTVVGTSDTQILTNKTITDTSNYVTATMLKSLTTAIDVSAATAPSSGQVLTATSPTTATWQIPTDTTKVSKTGDTMTGTLNLPPNGLIVGTNQLVVSGGNVGIGTTMPGNYKLAVEGSIRIAHVRDILSATVNEESFIRFSGGDYVGMRVGNANAIAFFAGRTSKNVTYTSKNDGSRYFVVAPTDVGGEILPSTTFTVGANTYTVDWYRESQGWVYVFENISGEVATGTLTGIKVASMSTTLASGGNVGIGTATPDVPLHIKKAAVQLKVDGTGFGSSAQITLLDAQSNGREWRLVAGQSNSGGIQFYNATNGIQAMEILPSGNVGIGTTNPTAKLHIGGTAGIDGIKFPDGTTQTTAAILTRPKTTGSFTGNGSTNRAIAHGLGMVPFQVTLWDGLRTVIIRYKNAATPVCQNNHVENGGMVDTTLWDATNFYVTGATEGGNTTGQIEYWTAYA